MSQPPPQPPGSSAPTQSFAEYATAMNTQLEKMMQQRDYEKNRAGEQGLICVNLKIDVCHSLFNRYDGNSVKRDARRPKKGTESHP